MKQRVSLTLQIVVSVILVGMVFFCEFANGETIKLKSGKTIEGVIVKKTDEFIQLDTTGAIQIIYYFDEIESINGANVGLENEEGVSDGNDYIQRSDRASVMPQDVILGKTNATQANDAFLKSPLQATDVLFSDEELAQLLNEGMKFIGNNENLKAVSTFKLILGADPQNVFAHYYLAFALMNLGEIDQALSFYNSAAEKGYFGQQSRDAVGEILAQYQAREFDVEPYLSMAKFSRFMFQGIREANGISLKTRLRTLKKWDGLMVLVI